MKKKEQIKNRSIWVFLQKGRFLKKPVNRRFSYAGAKIHLIRKRCKSNHSNFYVIFSLTLGYESNNCANL